MSMKSNAISMLKEDHVRVRGLLEKLTSTTDRGLKTRQVLLADIERELKVHMHLEEEIFYPDFKSAGEKKADDKLYYEAKEEHRAASRTLADLKRADVASVAFGGKAKVLKELVDHHANEEEKEMFPRVKDLMSQKELEELGSRMQQRKQELEHGRAWDTTSSAQMVR
jgi:hemerythrin superfamily protein